jgi:hypothetical protein
MGLAVRRRMPNARVLWLASICLAAGCFHHAHDVTAHFGPPRPDSGALDLVLVSPSRALTVAVDGNLVVDRAHTRKVHVDGVPAGATHVQVAVGGRCERSGVADEIVDVPAGGTAAVVLPGPDRDLACAVAIGILRGATGAFLIHGAFHLAHAIHGHFAMR